MEETRAEELCYSVIVQLCRQLVTRGNLDKLLYRGNVGQWGSFALRAQGGICSFFRAPLGTGAESGPKSFEPTQTDRNLHPALPIPLARPAQHLNHYSPLAQSSLGRRLASERTHPHGVREAEIIIIPLAPQCESTTDEWRNTQDLILFSFFLSFFLAEPPAQSLPDMAMASDLLAQRRRLPKGAAAHS